MKNYKLISILLICNFALQGQVIIRPAVKTDLPDLINLDRLISYEYFVPLVPQFFTEYFSEQQYIDQLEKEINEMDPELFQKATDQVDGQNLFVAVDQESNTLVGYTLCLRERASVDLSFGGVLRSWQRQGIGTRLIQATLNCYDDITSFTAWPLQCNRDYQILYEKVGFVNTGPGPADQKNCFGFGLDKWNYLYKLQRIN